MTGSSRGPLLHCVRRDFCGCIGCRASCFPFFSCGALRPKCRGGRRWWIGYVGLVPVLLDLCIYRGVCGCLSWYRQSERGNSDNVALLCRDASDTPAPRSALRVWPGGNCCHLSVDMAACRLFPGLLLLRLCAQGIASRHTWRLPRMTRIVHCKTWWDSCDWSYRAAESVQRELSCMAGFAQREPFRGGEIVRQHPSSMAGFAQRELSSMARFARRA